MPGFHGGQAPGNKGLRYPADPPKVEEIIAVMRAAGDGAHGRRLRGLIVIMWRAGLRTQEGLALTEGDRRFAPHQLRHAHAVEMAREGVPLSIIQRQLGHSNLGITSVYLQGIDSGEIIETVHARRAPMIPVSASLRL
jgi:site-specific recombinase XerD